jgi:PAS domain S-box-containing protein
VHQKAVEITGHTSAEVMGKHFVSNFISEDFRTSVQHVLDSALKHGQATANFELPLFTKNGSRVEVLLNANPRRDELGVIFGVVGVGQDITVRKKTEIELQRVAGDLMRLMVNDLDSFVLLHCFISQVNLSGHRERRDFWCRCQR